MKKFIGFALCLVVCFALGAFVAANADGFDFLKNNSSDFSAVGSSTKDGSSDVENSGGMGWISSEGGNSGTNGEVADKNEDNKNNNSSALSNIFISPAKTVVKQSDFNGVGDVVSYKDDNYFYFVFDLGTYANLRVDSPYGYCYYGGSGEVTRTMTASSASSNTIKNSTSSVISETTTKSSTKDVKIKVSVDFPKWIDLEVETGYSRTIGSVKESSWSSSYEEASSYSESEALSTSISFKNGDPTGWYYYYLSVDVKAYGVIVKDVKTGDFYATVKSSVIGRGFNYVYSESEGFDMDVEGGLNFDLGIIESLGLDEIEPENYIGSKIEDGKIHVQTVEGLYSALKESAADDCIVLDCNIECSSFPWMPIDNFYGTLDGYGYSIKGLSYVAEKDESNDSMFGMFKCLNGKIRNVVFENVNIHVWKYHVGIENIYVGTVCGKLTGGEIKTCEIAGSSNVYACHDTDNKKQKTHAYVGGFAGQVESGKIVSCKVTSAAIYGRTRINYSSNDTTADCWCYIGGIVGLMSGGTVNSCSRYNVVSVLADATYGSSKSAYHVFAGGIVGYKEGGSVSSCVSTQEKVSINLDPCGSKKCAKSSTKGHNAICGNG